MKAAANFKASEQRRCFKFNRLLADCKLHAVNLGVARLCSGSKQYKVAVDRSAKFRACELILSGALQSRA